MELTEDDMKNLLKKIKYKRLAFCEILRKGDINTGAEYNAFRKDLAIIYQKKIYLTEELAFKY